MYLLEVGGSDECGHLNHAPLEITDFKQAQALVFTVFHYISPINKDCNVILSSAEMRISLQMFRQPSISHLHKMVQKGAYREERTNKRTNGRTKEQTNKQTNKPGSQQASQQASTQAN